MLIQIIEDILDEFQKMDTINRTIISICHKKTLNSKTSFYVSELYRLLRFLKNLLSLIVCVFFLLAEIIDTHES